MADEASSTPEVFVVSVISRLLTDLVARNDQVRALLGTRRREGGVLLSGL